MMRPPGIGIDGAVVEVIERLPSLEGSRQPRASRDRLQVHCQCQCISDPELQALHPLRPWA